MKNPQRLADDNPKLERDNFLCEFKLRYSPATPTNIESNLQVDHDSAFAYHQFDRGSVRLFLFVVASLVGVVGDCEHILSAIYGDLCTYCCKTTPIVFFKKM